jgi:hypothetical protein
MGIVGTPENHPPKHDLIGVPKFEYVTDWQTSNTEVNLEPFSGRLSEVTLS